MPYNVTIQNEEGVPMRGVLYYYDADHMELGQTVVYPSGADLDIDLVNASASFRATADGYYWYGGSTSRLEEWNVITLIKKESSFLPYVVGGVVGLTLYNLLSSKSIKVY